MSFWPPLPAPGAGGIVSQDTYLNNDTALSIVGGGVGGTVPPNLSLSTLTVNATGYVSTLVLNGVSSINGAIYPPAVGSVPANLLLSTLTVSSLVTAPTANITDSNLTTITNLSSIQFAEKSVYGGFTSILMNGIQTANNPYPFIQYGTKNGEEGILSVEIIQNNVTTGLANTYLSMDFEKAFLNASTPQGTGSLYVSGSTIGVRGGPFSVNSVINVSSINGAVYPPAAGSVPANLLVSTLGVNPSGSISTPSITVTGEPGSVATERGITLGYNPGAAGRSVLILFDDVTATTPQIGQLSLGKDNSFATVARGGTTSGLAVSAYSTILGSYQPVACSDLFLYSLESDGANLAYTLEAKNTPVSSLNVQAPNVNISSLIGVSSINGINWAAISTLVG